MSRRGILAGLGLTILIASASALVSVTPGTPIFQSSPAKTSFGYDYLQGSVTHSSADNEYTFETDNGQGWFGSVGNAAVARSTQSDLTNTQAAPTGLRSHVRMQAGHFLWYHSVFGVYFSTTTEETPSVAGTGNGVGCEFVEDENVWVVKLFSETNDTRTVIGEESYYGAHDYNDWSCAVDTAALKVSIYAASGAPKMTGGIAASFQSKPLTSHWLYTTANSFINRDVFVKDAAGNSTTVEAWSLANVAINVPGTVLILDESGHGHTLTCRASYLPDGGARYGSGYKLRDKSACTSSSGLGTYGNVTLFGAFSFTNATGAVDLVMFDNSGANNGHNGVGYNLWLDAQHHLHSELRGSVQVSNATLTPGNHTFAASRNFLAGNEVVDVYVDGVIAYHSQVVAVRPDPSVGSACWGSCIGQVFLIGHGASTSCSFDCPIYQFPVGFSVYEVRVWKRALNATTIGQLTSLTDETLRLKPEGTEEALWSFGDSINADADTNGLPDAWCESNFGSFTCNPASDPDQDGCNNLCEWQNHTDPNNPSSVPGTDEDGDGWDDASEVACMGDTTSLPGGDADSDGVTNMVECGARSNPKQACSTPTDLDGSAWAAAHPGENCEATHTSGGGGGGSSPGVAFGFNWILLALGVAFLGGAGYVFFGVKGVYLFNLNRELLAGIIGAVGAFLCFSAFYPSLYGWLL